LLASSTWPGVQPGQFTVGSHETISSLSDLEPRYRQLIDEPVTAIVSVTGANGRSNLTPVWFDYENDAVLLNLATHRKKVDWLRKSPQATFTLMNPENAYHWLSIKTTVAREISEKDPEEGPRVTKQLDKIWTKYTGNEPPTRYATRPSRKAACCSSWPSTRSPSSVGREPEPTRRGRRRLARRPHRGPRSDRCRV
jgi:nitroimidazol reductase NimA-like FMN-containing flavoprotein (pyridoxamine 5'-phosphate oxidase superfamily)